MVVVGFSRTDSAACVAQAMYTDPQPRARRITKASKSKSRDQKMKPHELKINDVCVASRLFLGGCGDRRATCSHKKNPHIHHKHTYPRYTHPPGLTLDQSSSNRHPIGTGRSRRCVYGVVQLGPPGGKQSDACMPSAPRSERGGFAGRGPFRVKGGSRSSQ